MVDFAPHVHSLGVLELPGNENLEDLFFSRVVQPDPDGLVPLPVRNLLHFPGWSQPITAICRLAAGTVGPDSRLMGVQVAFGKPQTSSLRVWDALRGFDRPAVLATNIPQVTAVPEGAEAADGLQLEPNAAYMIGPATRLVVPRERPPGQVWSAIRFG